MVPHRQHEDVGIVKQPLGFLHTRVLAEQEKIYSEFSTAKLEIIALAETAKAHWLGKLMENIRGAQAGDN